MNCSAAILSQWRREDPDRLLQAALMGSLHSSRPAECQRPQELHLNFGIDCGGVRAPVPEYFSDLPERSSLGQHVSCQTVSKKVRTLARGFDTRFSQRALYDVGNGSCTAKPGTRSVATDEDAAAGALWSVIVQILCDGLAHIYRQR